MYTHTVSLYVRLKHGADQVTITRDLALPFAPVPGQTLIFGAHPTLKLKEVEYLVSEEEWTLGVDVATRTESQMYFWMVVLVQEHDFAIEEMPVVFQRPQQLPTEVFKDSPRRKGLSVFVDDETTARLRKHFDHAFDELLEGADSPG